MLTHTITHYISHIQTPLVVAVSGGSDSMCALHLIAQAWLQLGRDPTHIHVAHYHHGVRSESDQEVEFILDHCQPYTCHIDYYQGTSHKERDLRIARYQFFDTIIHRTGSRSLITGHHLTDRIETSLLNMTRGCQIKGFINMQAIDPVYQTQDKRRVHAYDIVRPLLTLPKSGIVQYCTQHHIPFVVDQSNHDPLVSQRNRVRHDVITTLDDTQLQSRKQLYDYLTTHQHHYPIPIRNQEHNAYMIGPIGTYTNDHLIWLFDWSGTYHDMTQGRIRERQHRLATSYQGHKILGQWKWYINQKIVYLQLIT